MKLLILALIALSTAAHAQSACSQAEENTYTSATNAYQGGMVTNLEVQLASLNLLLAQLQCNEISRQDYCQQITNPVALIRQLATPMAIPGNYDLQIDAETQVRAAEHFCTP